jgi:hypothetical protein
MSDDSFEAVVEQRRRQTLARIAAVPVSILIWGPAPTAETLVARTRRELRRALESDGHLVRYSEELYDPMSEFSLLAQQVADVEAHDITFSLPDSPGSIAEIHDFARIPGVANRIVTFLDCRKNDGYSNTTLLQLQSTATSRIQLYQNCDLPNCVVDVAKALVRRLQEFYYLIGRRF